MTLNRRSFLGVAAAVGFVPAVVRAEETWEQAGERRLHEDWPWIQKYAADNAKLIAAGTKTDIVMMGDSITEGWRDKRPGFFKPGRVGRGIGGQTTPQMVLRMMPDVIALKPRAVHIMAGTNDIAGNTGPMTRKMTYDNIAAMATLARGNGIAVILASIPPAAAFPWRPGLDVVGPIREINAWIKDYAGRTGAVWVDYTPALADAAGAMKPGYAYDGVHPTEQGYDVMASVLEPVLSTLGYAG